MRLLKRSLDPKAILNPGKIIKMDDFLKRKAIAVRQSCDWVACIVLWGSS